jgi:hypothetical protein
MGMVGKLAWQLCQPFVLLAFLSFVYALLRLLPCIYRRARSTASLSMQDENVQALIDVNAGMNDDGDSQERMLIANQGDGVDRAPREESEQLQLVRAVACLALFSCSGQAESTLRAFSTAFL